MDKKDIEKIVKETAFVMYFKQKIWEAMEGSFLPEDKLDKIAREIYEKYIEPMT